MDHMHQSKDYPLRSVRLSLSDVKQIFERLSNVIAEQAQKELALLEKPEDENEEKWKEDIASIKSRAFRITVTVMGIDGDSYYNDSVELFDSPNLPDMITSIYMTNKTAYSGVAQRDPEHGFYLYLDFAKPPLLDCNNPVSGPTLNHSNLHVEGSQEGWIAAVSEAVLRVALARQSRRKWLHAPFLYDWGMVFLGLPVSLYSCWKMSGLIETNLGSINMFLSSAAYVYIVFVTLWLYRIFFGYTKWVFPTIELEENRDNAKKHRVFWWSITVGLIGKAIWDLSGKSLLGSIV